MSKIPYFLKTKVGFISSISGLAVILFISFFIFSGNGNNLESYAVKIRNVSEEISVSGKVEASTDLDLSFERSGQVKTIPKKVGDQINEGEIILSLDNSSQSARLAQAQADLQIERIKLQELTGNSVSNITTSQNDLRLAQIEFDNAKDSLTEQIKETLLETNNAIKNNVDRLFEGGSFGATLISGSVKYYINTGDSAKKILINGGRSEVGRILEKSWANLDTENEPEQSAILVLSDLLTIQNFLNNLANVVNDISEPEDSTIKTSFNSLKDNVSTAIGSINSSLSELRSSLQTYNIKAADLGYISSQTSATGEDTRLQEAKVLSAEANVAAELASLNEGVIRAPVSGKITSVKTKIGEVVSANSPVITVVSNELYEVVINVPEADISKVSIGDPAEITLDAYSDDEIFLGKVVSIDLSETIVDGVVTYETKLQFSEKNEKIRSGMTANVEIFGEKKEEVLAVPQKAIKSRGGKRYVQILENEKVQEVEVETGLRGSDGFIEIISGINEGQAVLVSN